MERMKQKSLLFWIAPAVLVVLCAGLVCAACTGVKTPGEISPFDGIVKPGNSPGKVEMQDASSLERFAELERAGSYFPGMALAESEIREKAGDYAGAAVAVYKELSWAYGYGVASKNQVEEGLQNALVLFENKPLADSSRSSGAAAVRGCIAFSRGDWKEAEELLTGILSPGDEPDSFVRWMLLVCALEQAGKAGDKAARSAYGAIRARYTLFPEYWYRGARNVGAAYAEQCVNVSPQGPFAEGSRSILAEHFGLSPDWNNIRTKAEIENIIRASVSMNNPKTLEELFPLIALPDNPYTIYALGAMQALSSVPEFRSFFIEGALKSPGRLGERLNYISRS